MSQSQGVLLLPLGRSSIVSFSKDTGFITTRIELRITPASSVDDRMVIYYHIPTVDDYKEESQLYPHLRRVKLRGTMDT